MCKNVIPIGGACTERAKMPTYECPTVTDRSKARHSVLAVTVVAFIASMVARVIISPLIPAFLDVFDVSRGTIGLALTGMWAATALTQFPAGLLGQRYGEERIILLSLALTACGSLLLSASTTFYVFTVTVLILGLAGGLYMPVAASFLTKTFQRTGRVLGIHSIGAPIGGLVGPIIVTYFLANGTWQAPPLVVAVAVFAVATLFFWHVGTPDGDSAPDDSAIPLRPRLLLGLFGRPRVFFTAVLAAVGFFVFQAITTFLPTFLVEYAGFSTGRAGLLFSGVFATAIGGAPALGWLSDHFGRDTVLVGGFLATAGGIGVFLTGTTGLAVASGTLLIGVGISWNGVLNSRLMDQFGDAERTVSFGFVRTGILLVSSLGSVVTGTLADAFGWAVAFGLLLSIMVGAALLLVGNLLIGSRY